MALRIFESVFYKSLVRACSFDNSLAASQNARSYVQTIDHRTLRICKKRIQKVLILPLLLIHDLSFSFIYIPYNRTLFKSPHRECMLNGIGDNFKGRTTGRCVCFTVLTIIISVCHYIN